MTDNCFSLLTNKRPAVQQKGRVPFCVLLILCSCIETFHSDFDQANYRTIISTASCPSKIEIIMGSAASWGNREQTSPDTAEAAISREEWEKQGRELLSRVRIIPPVQRRRAGSVGYPTQNGIYWVYWRPKEARQQAAGGKTGNQGVITFGQNKKTD